MKSPITDAELAEMRATLNRLHMRIESGLPYIETCLEPWSCDCRGCQICRALEDASGVLSSLIKERNTEFEVL